MEDYVIIYRSFITVRGGRRIYARSYGLRALRLRIPRAKYKERA